MSARPAVSARCGSAHEPGSGPPAARSAGHAPCPGHAGDGRRSGPLPSTPATLPAEPHGPPRLGRSSLPGPGSPTGSRWPPRAQHPPAQPRDAGRHLSSSGSAPSIGPTFAARPSPARRPRKSLAVAYPTQLDPWQRIAPTRGRTMPSNTGRPTRRKTPIAGQAGRAGIDSRAWERGPPAGTSGHVPTSIGAGA